VTAAAQLVTDPMLLATIDFEASIFPSRGRSFPIEAGLSRVSDGLTASWLIRPTPEWLTWDWDEGAEDTHGISLDEARQRGRPVDEVLREMSAFAAGLTVLSDSGLDDLWLETLAAAAQRHVPFAVLLAKPVLETFTQDEDEIDAARMLAIHRFPRLHRAGPDARNLAEYIRILAGIDTDVA
jgi:hypothetical protein